MQTNNKIELKFPLPRTHCGIPMGNGNFGALIWGSGQSLCITVNRSDFWDHRGGEVIEPGVTYKELLCIAKSNDYRKLIDAFKHKKFSNDVFRPQRLPLGRFELLLCNEEELTKAVLEYCTGCLQVFTTSGKSLCIDLSCTQNFLLIHDESKIIYSVKSVPSWHFEKSKNWLIKYGFSPPCIIKKHNVDGWIQACPQDLAAAAVCNKLNNYLYAVTVELIDNKRMQPKAIIEKLKNINYHSIKKENSKWWRTFWKDTPELFLPDEFFNTFYKYALYKFACATNPDGNVPAGLQGPWVEEYQPAPWSGDYHFNVNIQQIYTLAFAIGKVSHLLPLFKMIESDSFQANMKLNAKNLFGIEEGLLMTHAVDDKGYQCGLIAPATTLDQACGAWVAYLYWQYYQHSKDDKFLKERAFPFMCGVMRVYEEMLDSYEDHLSIPLAISPEYGFVITQGLREGRAPSYQLAAMHMLLDALLATCEIIGEEPKKIWHKMKEQLPHFTIIDRPSPGTTEIKKHIAIWKNQDLEISHRHHSHLACIYPFDSLPQILNDEYKQIINNSIDHWLQIGMGQWSEWSIPWAVIIQTRLGLKEAPLTILNLWKDVFVNEGLATAYFPRYKGVIAHCKDNIDLPKESNEIMQLDGTMGGATAVLEMLAHTHAGVTKLFAGVPEKWGNVSFCNIHQPGPFLISAEKRNGSILSIRIKNIAADEIKLDTGNLESFISQSGEIIVMPATIKLEANTEIYLKKVE